MCTRVGSQKRAGSPGAAGSQTQVLWGQGVKDFNH